MSEREGPKALVRLSCDGCKHCESKRYVAQGDSGYSVACLLAGKHVGDSGWDTPSWCPLRNNGTLSTDGGALVLLPGDTSPLGELVRAAVKYERAVTPWEQERAEETLNACISVAFADPAVRAWVERGLK